MNKQPTSYKVLGIMSGTSLDGLDLCLANYMLNNQQWEFEILAAQTLPYSDYWKQQLINCETNSGEELIKSHFEYGEYLGKTALNFIKSTNEHVDFISSHGHTIFHQIEKKITFQLGSGAALAAHSKHKVIADFRSQDVTLGGQGAPLVPVGDLGLFPKYDSCINLGGICNFSYQSHDKVLAYDIAPCNMVLNYLMQRHFDKEYDVGGEISKSGKIDQALLNQLNKIEFYHQNPPKSLGREWVFEQVIPLLDASQITPQDKLCSFTNHIAIQISEAIKKETSINKILITGGGSKNIFLIELLKNLDLNIEVPNEQLIDYKEALIFGYLGIKRLREETNIFNTVTGSSKNTSSGSIYLP